MVLSRRRCEESWQCQWRQCVKGGQGFAGREGLAMFDLCCPGAHSEISCSGLLLELRACRVRALRRRLRAAGGSTGLAPLAARSGCKERRWQSNRRQEWSS